MIHIRETLPQDRAGGFTLTELAIVLVIVALLIGGLMVSLSTSRDIASDKETRQQLATAVEALLGFAITNERLPCPAVAGATGTEAPVGGGVCTTYYNGFLPAITLGLSPTDAQGYAIDAWGNRIRYAVTAANANSFTAAAQIKTNWSGGLLPDLHICNTATGINGSPANCAAGASLSTNAVVVVFSTGKNGGTVPTSADELANWSTSGDRAFVSTTPSTTYDDLVTWLSPNILYNRMIAAGRLP